MTSEQAFFGWWRFAAVLVCSLIAGGCSKPKQPDILVAPYATDAGDVLWAVAPFANETGDSLFDPLPVTDAFIRSAEQVVGLAVVPMPRVRIAMARLGMMGVQTTEQANALAEALGADAIVVGSVTSYVPYDPPRLGMALVLRATTDRTRGVPRTVEIGGLRSSVSGRDSVSAAPVGPANAAASVLFDARNEQTLGEIRRYARGRVGDNSVLGVRSYTQSMSLFTEFATYASVRRLLDKERLRLVRAGAGRTQNRP